MPVIQPSERLGLIAGKGRLPQLVAEYAAKNNLELVIAGYEGVTPAENMRGAIAAQSFAMGKAGALIAFLKQHNVKQLILVGQMVRPSNWLALKPDAKALGIISKIILKSLGDDGLLKILKSELEAEGFKLMAVQTLMPELLCRQGVLTEYAPNEDDFESITVGFNAAKDWGRRDKGQSVVVQGGVMLALEDHKGTNALIKKAAEIKAAEPKPILIKACKPQQDKALDMPTIGVETVRAVAAAGFKGICVEAGATLIVDEAAVVEECNRASLFLMGMPV